MQRFRPVPGRHRFPARRQALRAAPIVRQSPSPAGMQAIQVELAALLRRSQGRRYARQNLLDFALSAGDAHVARYGRSIIGAVNDEIMAFGLAGDCLSDRRIERTVPFRCAERGAQIGCVLVPQTHVKPACARHPHSIAGLAKIVGQRRDEADQAASFAHSHIARGSACRWSVSCKVKCRASCARTFVNGKCWSIRAVSISPSGMTSMNVIPMLRACAQRTIDFELIFVHTLERNDIDFHREPRPLRGVNPREHAIEIATRVMALNRPGSRVSSETLIRRTRNSQVHRRTASVASRSWSASSREGFPLRDAVRANRTAPICHGGRAALRQ